MPNYIKQRRSKKLNLVTCPICKKTGRKVPTKNFTAYVHNRIL